MALCNNEFPSDAELALKRLTRRIACWAWFTSVPRLGSVDPYLAILGQRIRAKLNWHSMSQKALGYRARMDRSYVAGIKQSGYNLILVALVKLCRMSDLRSAREQ